MKKLIQLAAITVVLIALPAASWYFLKSGLDYRKESMRKLGDFGNLPNQDLSVKGKSGLSTNDLENQTILIQKIDTGTDTVKIMQLFRQFEKRSDFKLLVPEHPQLELVSVNKPNLWLLSEDVNSSKLFQALGLIGANEDQVALIDFRGKIRNYYSLDDESDLRQLVEHTAFLLPVAETAKPQLKRQEEK